jgi:hypothetical protein
MVEVSARVEARIREALEALDVRQESNASCALTDVKKLRKALEVVFEARTNAVAKTPQIKSRCGVW